MDDSYAFSKGPSVPALSQALGGHGPGGDAAAPPADLEASLGDNNTDG